MRLGYRKRHTAAVVLFPLLCAVVLICFICHTVLKRAEPAFVAQTSNYSNTAFTDLVNKCIIEITEREDYGDFFKIVSSDGIAMVEADTSKINVMTSKLLINIQNSLNEDYPSKVYIPLGSLTKYYVLSSAGPSVPIKIIPISVVNCKIEDVFESVGINQTRHKIYLRIWVDMHYSGYLLDEKERIETTVPVAETVISGEVPNFYGNGLVGTANST